MADDPVLIDRFPKDAETPNRFFGISESNGQVFTVTYGVGDDNCALRVFSGPDPLVQNQYTDPAYYNALNGFSKVVAGDEAVYVLYRYNAAGNWRSGVRIFDRYTLDEYNTRGRMNWIGLQAGGLALCGSILYVVGDDGLYILDVSDPDVENLDPGSGPQMLSISRFTDVGLDVTLEGSMAFVADGREGLKIVDVGDPENPALLGTWLPPDGLAVRAVHVDGFMAYLVGTGFWILDISNPASPQLLGSRDEGAYRLCAANDFVYVAGEYGMRVYDISDPANPVLTGRYTTPYRSEDVACVPPYVYLADRSGLFSLQHGSVPAMEVSLEADRTNGEAPFETRIVADLSGGEPDYHYTWFVDDEVVYAGEEGFLDQLFEEAEMYLVRVTVEDGNGKIASASMKIDARGALPRVHGVVRQVDSGEPVRAATVTLHGAGNSVSRSYTVNPAGQYRFEDLEAGLYRLLATAPDYTGTSRMIGLKYGDNKQVDVDLAALLPEELVRRKRELIRQLAAFPQGFRWSPTRDWIAWLPGDLWMSDTVHPYAEAEALTGRWLDEQETLTEALQRLTLAEGAFKLMAEDAVIYASYTGGYLGSAIGDTLNLTMSLIGLDKWIKRNYPKLDAHGVLIDKLSRQITTRLFVMLRRAAGAGLSTVEGRKAFNAILRTVVAEFAKTENVNVNQFMLDWKARLGNHFAEALIEDFGAATEPLLTDMLDLAIAGGPYPMGYEDSRAEVLGWLRLAANKREIIINSQGAIDTVAIQVFSNLDYLLTVVEGLHAGFPADPEGAFAKYLNALNKAAKIYAKSVNVEMALDRLGKGLPSEMENMVYAAFGDPQPLTGRTFAAKPGPRSAFQDAFSIKLTAGDPVPDFAHALETLSAGDLNAFPDAILNAVDALNAYLEEIALTADAARTGGVVEASAILEFENQLNWCYEQVEAVLAASLELLYFETGEGVSSAGSRLRENLGERIHTVMTSVGFLAKSSLALTPEETSEAAVPVLAIVSLSFEDAAGLPFLPEAAGLPVRVRAKVRNPGSVTAEGAFVELELMEGTLLKPGDEPLQQAIPPLAEGQTAELSWGLESTAAGFQRFEWIGVNLVQSGSGPPIHFLRESSMQVVPGPLYPDLDGDLISDAFEAFTGLDPERADDASSDSDNDGLTALEEFFGHSHPGIADTDGDGTDDGTESLLGLKPFDPQSHALAAGGDGQVLFQLFDFAGRVYPCLVVRTHPGDAAASRIWGSSDLEDWQPVLEFGRPTSSLILQSSESAAYAEWILNIPEADGNSLNDRFYLLGR